MVAVKPLKSATLIEMVNSVVVIVVYRGLIMDHTRIKQNAPSAVMFMVQMAQICSKGAARSVKKGRRGSDIGKL